MRLDRRLLAFVQKKLLFSSVGLGIGAALSGVGLIWFLSGAIDGVFLKAWDVNALLQALIWVMVFAVMRAALTYASSHFAQKMAERAKSALRSHVLEKSLTTQSKEDTGVQTTQWMRGVETLDAWFGQYLPQVFMTMAIPFLLLLIALWLDPLTAVVFVVSAPLLPLFLALIGLAAKHKTKVQWKMLSQQGNLYLETLQGLRTLKLFGRSEAWGVRLLENARILRDTTLEVLRIAFLSALVLEMVGTLGTAILAVEVGIRLLYGLQEYRIALFLLMLAPEFYLPLRTLGLRAHAAMEGDAAADAIFKSLEARTARPLWNKHDIPVDWNLQNVSARWSESLPWVLHQINFEWKGAGKLGIAGASGSGKSTLLAVLLGELAAEQGIASWNQKLRLSWVPQRVPILQRNMRDNLCLQASSESMDAQLWLILERVGLTQVVHALPCKLDTPVGAEGARLSGGQLRRLGLARAFVDLADWILLDEPEAHLDRESLSILEKALFEGRENLIIVSHRPLTLERCTKVLYLDQGQLVDCAPHLELLEKYPLYRQLMEGEA